jgi:7-cyano-7-deazaguanine tRNA-ribosyltransferase
MKPQHSALYAVEKEAYSSDARTGRLKVGNDEVSTPILWLGHRVRGNPKPWQAFHLPGVLMNAWDILSTGQASENIRKAGIQEYLNLGISCATFLDSGGYLYLKRDDVRPDPLEILGLYEDSAPTIGAILDHPLDPFLPAKVNEKRWRQTMANTRLMYERNGNVTLMPIVHAHSVDQANKACADLRQAVGEPVVLGIGSLVPLMRTHHNGEVLRRKPSGQSEAPVEYHQSSRHLVVEIIKTIRAEFPHAFLHVFGVGGTTTMHVMFALGVDSLDSIGWRLKAGYGAVQLPGFGDRFTGDRQRKKRTLLMDDEKATEALLECQCPVCQEHATLEKRLAALDKSFNNRALHNAWVFVQEADAFRAQIGTNSVESFVRERLQHSPLKSLLPDVFDRSEQTTDESA